MYYNFVLRLIQQMEVGLTKRIFNQWAIPKPSCGSSIWANQYASVSVKDIYLTLKVFGCGLCISLVILILEVTHYTWINRQNENKLHRQRLSVGISVRKNI